MFFEVDEADQPPGPRRGEEWGESGIFLVRIARLPTHKMSSFGSAYKITTFGESHCKSVGVVIDGVPAGLPLTDNVIQPQLSRRRPGQSKLTTPVSKMRDEGLTTSSATKRTRSSF